MKPIAARLAFAAIVALTSHACASAGEGAAVPRRTGDITPAELEGISATHAMDALILLRPQWLRARNGSATVVINSQRSDRERLAQIPIRSIARVTFMTPADATTRFGTGFFNGAIVVTLR